MRSQYRSLARAKIIEVLSHLKAGTAVDYDALYQEAMPFPFVTPNDLQQWVSELAPNVKLALSGSERRKKPQPDANDRVVVLNPGEIK